MIPALAHRCRRSVPAPARPRPSGSERERGGTLLIVTLMIIPLVIITALVVDIGYAKTQRRAIQATADAAALAAAHELRETGKVEDAIRAAKDWAAKNNAGLTDESWIGCKDTAALTDGHDSANDNECISFRLDDELRKVRVRIPDAIQPQFFSQVGDAGVIRVSAVAEAGFVPTTTPAPEQPSIEPGPCGLCVIGGGRLQLSGSSISVNVVGGRIQGDQLTANISPDDNLNISPVPLGWYSNNGSNWGRNYKPGDPAYSFANRYEKLSAPVPDPFPSDLAVDYSSLTLSGPQNPKLPAHTLLPNVIYEQNVEVTGTATLSPNQTYYFANTLIIKNGAKLIGRGVTLVFGCKKACSGEGGRINVESGGTLDITAPTDRGYVGFAILFDPGAKGQGNNLNGTVHLEGAIYGRKAGLNSSSNTKLKAWTVVTGANSNYNGGTFEIDNTKYAQVVGGTPPVDPSDPDDPIGGGGIRLLK